MTNQAVETAFGAGITQTNLDIIKETIQITYISAALRYLNKMDNHLTGTPVTEHREHQAEGHSFWLTAVVAGYDEAAAIDALDALYTNHAVPGLGGRYCEGLAALTHGMTADQLTMLGTLNEADFQTCHNTDATGRAAGMEITAAAKHFWDEGDVASKRTAYTSWTIGSGETLQSLAQGSGPDGQRIDAFIMSALDATGIFGAGGALDDEWARDEAYRKGVSGQLLTHLAVYYAEEAACGSAASAELYSKAAAIYGNPIGEHGRLHTMLLAGLRSQTDGVAFQLTPTASAPPRSTPPTGGARTSTRA